MALIAKEIIRELQLKSHSTCGFVAETYRSSHRIGESALPAGYEGDRPLGSALYPEGTGSVITVGGQLAHGMQPELFIPSGTFHVSRVVSAWQWALLSETAWPGVEPPDIEPGIP